MVVTCSWPSGRKEADDKGHWPPESFVIMIRTTDPSIHARLQVRLTLSGEPCATCTSEISGARPLCVHSA